jgi:hypothetical protein
MLLIIPVNLFLNLLTSSTISSSRILDNVLSRHTNVCICSIVRKSIGNFVLNNYLSSITIDFILRTEVELTYLEMEYDLLVVDRPSHVIVLYHQKGRNYTMLCNLNSLSIFLSQSLAM